MTAEDVVKVMGHAAGELADHFHFLRADKLPLQPFVFGARFDFLHGAAHRRSEPGEAFLQDIIRRPALERINGPFLAQRPGHHDDRQVRPPGARDFQRGQPVKRGEREIRKDQVHAAAFERRHKTIAALHAGGRASDAIGFQGGLNERGIVGIVLQVQDVERGFHIFTSSFVALLL